MLLLFQSKIQLHRKAIGKVAYIDYREDIDLMRGKLQLRTKYMGQAVVFV